MFDTKSFLKWLSALLTAAAALALTFIGERFAAFDPATVTSDPLVGAIAVAIVGVAARGVSWLVGKLPAS